MALASTSPARPGAGPACHPLGYFTNRSIPAHGQHQGKAPSAPRIMHDRLGDGHDRLTSMCRGEEPRCEALALQLLCDLAGESQWGPAGGRVHHHEGLRGRIAAC